MIKVYETKFRDRCKELIKEEHEELKREENRTASRLWKTSSYDFPEGMYHLFRDYLDRKAARSEKITFFDVGAAEGCYSCSVVEKFAKAKIIAFEPERPRAEIYIENIEQYMTDFNRNPEDIDISLHEVVVSDGVKNIVNMRHYVCPKTGGGAGSSSTIQYDRQNRISLDIPYEAVSLNSYIDQVDEVDIIKIDVEGGELAVLRSAGKFMDKFKPGLFLEVHGHEQNGSITIDQVKEIIETYESNYNIKLLETHPGPDLHYYLITPRKD